MLNRLVALFAAAVIFGLLYAGGVVSSLSNKTLDGLFLLRGPLLPEQDIIIVGVDDESLAELGPWPFSRRYHARLLSRLHQAKVIGFDFLFSEPGSEDAVFDKAMMVSPPVVLASVMGKKHVLAPASSLGHAFGSGHIEIVLGQDGVVRKAMLVEQTSDGPLTAFAAVMAQAAGKKQPLRPNDSILINHYGPAQTFLYLSYVDVLHGKFPKDFFKNRFVLVGAEALGIGDSHVTPFTRRDQTPGVEIQATILNNILAHDLLKPLTPVSWLAMFGIGLLCLFLWPGRTERYNLVINVTLAALLLLASVLLFRKSLFLDPTPPLLFLILCYLTHLISERIWTAKNIYSEMIQLDQQLKTGLQQVYANIPSRIFNLQPTPESGGVRQHLTHLRAGVKALSLQHHFIENILSKELPPLILWDHANGNVIMANAMFNTFWQTFMPDQAALPKLDIFFHLLENNRPKGETTIPDLSTLLEDNSSSPLDISLTAHGRKKFFRVNIHSVLIEDIGFDGVLALLTDVTEIRELEQLKDEIVSVVSHELKLPLTVILGYGEMLSGMLEGEEKLYVDKMSDQARRLNALIENFLDVTRLEHGRQEIKQLPLDPIALINEATDIIAQVANRKNITIKQDIPYKATPIMGDPTLLLQAITNILDNAVKFSPEHTEITVSLVEEPDRFILCIADQGPGIPAESHRAIFEKFNRGRQAPGRQGFGLGLNFVQQVVQKHGGKIRLQPETDSGATFCLELPKKSAK